MFDRYQGIGSTSENISLAALIAIILLLVVQLLPGITCLRTTARAAESKSGLHEIQKAVEKYHRDHGCYPSWLIGGAARYAATVDTTSLEHTFSDIRECSQPASVSDPLLREGYLAAYPVNPFVTAGVGIHQVQSFLPSAMMSSDPLRSGTETAAMHGTRFGPECKAMGNVMGDPRQNEWTWVDPATDYYYPARTYASIDYHQWDMWATEQPKPFLYGQFFYKSHWIIDPPPDNNRDMPRATRLQLKPPTMYMLGAYGGPSDRGQDVIGEEHYLEFDMGEDGIHRVWPYTRSASGYTAGTPQGSPYGPAPAGSSRQVSYGNPNGIDDAAVLLLTSE